MVMSAAPVIPRRRKTDFDRPDCSSCAGLDVLYERVYRIEETINMQFAALEPRLHALNQLRQEVVTDRSQFVQRGAFDSFKEHLDSRLRVTDRTVWIAMGAAAALASAFGALAQFLIAHAHARW